MSTCIKELSIFGLICALSLSFRKPVPLIIEHMHRNGQRLEAEIKRFNTQGRGLKISVFELKLNCHIPDAVHIL